MSTKGLLPDGYVHSRRRPSSLLRPVLLTTCFLIVSLTLLSTNYYAITVHRQESRRLQQIPINAQQILQQCSSLRETPSSTSSLTRLREVSDRFEPGTNATLIQNARIWTGRENGTHVVEGDVLLDGGIIKEIGHIPQDLWVDAENLTIVDANGAWITPGLVDLHSHVGLLSAPFTRGTFDVNSPNGPILPWLRSIDGFNTHDESFALAIAGGVTSAQVLPGSGNAIGGQAFMMKLRKTSERSPTSMILEPPHTLNGSRPDPNAPLRWRHLKQACGENLKKFGTRMDAMWSFRWAYSQARKIQHAQDMFCARAEAGFWNDIYGQEFPEDLQWEALVDVLRGRVKISNHCYEAVDLDDIVRLSNEFGFHIASFHHASEAWLVPGVLNRTFGGPPAVAVFATNHRYKRESYRGSEFATKVLAENGIPVVLKSDHPVLNSRYLLYEAQQAHYYGLDRHLALAAVTSTPAKAAGMEHRIGVLRKGADADVVLWDVHPLQLGAKPYQVWIDGIPQLTTLKPKDEDEERQEAPSVPNWDKERKTAVAWEGLPPLSPRRIKKGKVVLKNVREVWVREEHGIKERWSARPGQEGGTVVLNDGLISCVGREGWCLSGEDEQFALSIDLHGGSIGPGIVTYGSRLGLEEIDSEMSTGDGIILDPYSEEIPKILSDTAGLVRAADALQFGTRNTQIAYRAGVTYATTSLSKSSLFTGPYSLISGLSVTFRTGANHGLEHGAIVNPATALHVALVRPHPFGSGGVLPPVSVSTQVAALRRLLLNAENHDTETGKWFKRAAEGIIPLVVDVHSADMMATLIQLKADIEEWRGSRMQLVFSGATEAYILAKQIAKANVGVLLTPARSFPGTWDQRRALPGPPLTDATALEILLQHGVTVAIGVDENYQPAHTRFEAAWAALNTNGRISRQKTYELITTNVEKLFGIEGWFGEEGDLVLYDGGSVFDLSSKVVGVASPKKNAVELF